MTRRRDLARSAAVLLVSIAVLSATPAQAVFNDVTASPAISVSSALLAPPTGLAAANGCVLTIPRVVLTWTATTSTFATGYQIYRKIGVGAFLPLATVSGRTTTTYTDTPVLVATTYTYYVAASIQGWSADSSSVSITTPALCI